MSIDGAQALGRGYRDMIIPHAHDFPVLEMSPVYPGVFLPVPCAKGQPYVAEFSEERSREVSKMSIRREIRDYPVASYP